MEPTDFSAQCLDCGEGASFPNEDMRDRWADQHGPHYIEYRDPEPERHLRLVPAAR